MITNDTLFANVSELAAQIRARKLSPVELTEGYLQRLETVGKRLNAVAYVMRETALREARQAEDEIKRGRYRGPLHGIPFGVKDLCATREAPTSRGATRSTRPRATTPRCRASRPPAYCFRRSARSGSASA